MNHEQSTTQKSFRDDSKGKRMRGKNDFEEQKWLYSRNTINIPGILLGQPEKIGCFSGNVRLILVIFMNFSGTDFFHL